MTKFKQLSSPWKETSNSNWLFSRITLKRNIKNYKFPGKMQAEERRSIRDVLCKTLKKYPAFKTHVFYKASELSPGVKDYLYEHFLSSSPLQHMHQGEGVMYDSKGNFLCQLNYLDHIRLSLISDSNDLFATWKKIVDCELFLEKELGFSFSSRFGFLTACSQDCGIGLDVRSYLQVPALIYTGEIEKHKEASELLQLESLEGGASSFVGDLVVLKNIFSLGCKEEVLLSQMQELALKLAVEEQSLRQELKVSSDAKLEDLIGRAFGTLKFSYQLDMHEALEALGKLCLGISLGSIRNISEKQLNKLLFAAGRGHLSLNCDLSTTGPEEVNQARASFFRKAFKRVSLKE